MSPEIPFPKPPNIWFNLRKYFDKRIDEGLEVDSFEIGKHKGNKLNPQGIMIYGFDGERKVERILVLDLDESRHIVRESEANMLIEHWTDGIFTGQVVFSFIDTDKLIALDVGDHFAHEEDEGWDLVGVYIWDEWDGVYEVLCGGVPDTAFNGLVTKTVSATEARNKLLKLFGESLVI